MFKKDKIGMLFLAVFCVPALHTLTVLLFLCFPLCEQKSHTMPMGDLQLALLAMLGEKGCDACLLQDGDGNEADKDSLMFTQNNQMIL
jgi:hypothetical protein